MNKIDISKYLGIPFEHRRAEWGGVDCYGLVRLFYRSEFKIEIPDYEYSENWCKQGFDWIQKYFKENWVRINTPIRYGIVGFRLPGYHVEHHVGIVLYDLAMFLHSPLNMPVCVSNLNTKAWKRAVSNYYEIKGR